MWTEIRPPQPVPAGGTMTPGGFHSFEHRWAFHKAFQFHETIGRQRIQDRIHTLNRQLKDGLAKIHNVKLHTPLADELLEGIDPRCKRVHPPRHADAQGCAALEWPVWDSLQGPAARCHRIRRGARDTGVPATLDPRPARPQTPGPTPAARRRVNIQGLTVGTSGKNADPEIPILKEAKAEYTKLQ